MVAAKRVLQTARLARLMMTKLEVRPRWEICDSGANGNGGQTLSTTGEGHGVIEFAGTISTLTWDSTVAENWNGFTVGEVIPGVPEPSSLSLLGTGLGAVGMLVRRRFLRG